MKYMLLSLALLLFIPAMAQYEDDNTYSKRSKSTISLPIDENTGVVTFSKVITSEGNTADDLFKRAQDFAKTNKSKFIFSNGQRNAGWEMAAGTRKANDKYDIQHAESDVGLVDINYEERTVYARCAWRHEGSMMACPRLLMVKADVFFQSKDGKTRVLITNLSYNHYNISTGRPEAIYAEGLKDAGPCKSSGPVDELLQCKRCKGGMNKFLSFLQETSDSFFTSYETYLSKPSISNSDW